MVPRRRVCKHEKATIGGVEGHSSVLCIGCAQQNPIVTETGLVRIMSADIYIVSGSVGVLTTAMIPHDIVVDPYSGFNISARASLPLGWEQHKEPEAHMLL